MSFLVTKWSNLYAFKCNDMYYLKLQIKIVPKVLIINVIC